MEPGRSPSTTTAASNPRARPSTVTVPAGTSACASGAVMVALSLTAAITNQPSWSPSWRSSSRLRTIDVPPPPSPGEKTSISPLRASPCWNSPSTGGTPSALLTKSSAASSGVVNTTSAAGQTATTAGSAGAVVVVVVLLVVVEVVEVDVDDVVVVPPAVGSSSSPQAKSKVTATNMAMRVRARNMVPPFGCAS